MSRSIPSSPGPEPGPVAAASPEILLREPGALAPPLLRRFVLAGIAATLTAGATWGAVLLVRIAAARSFTALSIFEVNAHGQAQIYGWVGLFVMGFAYAILPRLVGAPPPHPRLAALSFPVMVGGIALRAVAEPWGPGPAAGSPSPAPAWSSRQWSCSSPWCYPS